MPRKAELDISPFNTGLQLKYNAASATLCASLKDCIKDDCEPKANFHCHTAFSNSTRKRRFTGRPRDLQMVTVTACSRDLEARKDIARS